MPIMFHWQNMLDPLSKPPSSPYSFMQGGSRFYGDSSGVHCCLFIGQQRWMETDPQKARRLQGFNLVNPDNNIFILQGKGHLVGLSFNTEMLKTSPTYGQYHLYTHALQPSFEPTCCCSKSQAWEALQITHRIQQLDHVDEYLFSEQILAQAYLHQANIARISGESQGLHLQAKRGF